MPSPPWASKILPPPAAWWSRLRGEARMEQSWREECKRRLRPRSLRSDIQQNREWTSPRLSADYRFGRVRLREVA